ncbi:MAG: PQQ-binding-like beta-propeller repeat protein, partial [Trebonia sp.]
MSESPSGEASGGGRRRSRRRITIIGILVALVAAGGSYLGVSLTSGGGLTTSWTGNHLASGCASTSDNVPWTAGDLAVTCSGHGVAAYRLGSGQVAWTWEPPKSPGAAALRGPGPSKQAGTPYLSILELSAGTSDGIGVAEYTYGAGTVYLAGIQVATGRELWRRSDVSVTDGSTVWVSDGRVAVVASTSNSADAVRVYDLTSGALDWSSTAGGVPARGCYAQTVAIAGASVYAVASCPPTGGTRDDQLYQLALATGAVRGHAALQDSSCSSADGYPTLWAVPGYVLSGCQSAPQTSPDVLVIPAGGVRQLQLSYRGDPKYVNFLSSDLMPPAMTVYGTTLYLATSLNVGDKSVYLASAVDLRTDTLRWDKTVSIPGEAASSVTYPVNLIGASSQGALDVVENISADAEDLTGTTAMTLAVLSASNGTVTYGPGATYSDGLNDQPLYNLIGHTLLALPVCALADCDVANEPAAVTAYDT